MQTILTVILPIAFVFVGGQTGKALGNPILGYAVGLTFALIYLGILRRGDFLMARGSKAIRAGRIDEGLAFYRKALKTNLRPEYAVYAGYSFLRYGKDEECLATLDAAEQRKNLPVAQKKEIHNTRGLCHYLSGRLADAENEFRRAHALGPDSQTYSHVGFILIAEEKLDEAFAFNKEAMDFNEDDPSIADNMAYCHYLRGEIDEAVALYEKIMERGTHFPVIYYNYALCLEKKGKLAEALEQLECALTYKFSRFASVSKETVEQKAADISARLKSDI